MNTQGESLVTWSGLRWASRRAAVMAAVLLGALALVAWLVGGATWGVLYETLGWWLAGFGAAALMCAIVSDVAMWWMRGGSRWGYFAKDEAKLAYLASVMELCPSDVRLVRVGRVDGIYPTGSRYAVRDSDGEHSSSWFVEAWPTRGDVLLVRGGYGRGHHWGDANVLYVNEVLTRLPSWVWGALRRRARTEAREEQQWQRAERREQRERARDEKYAVEITQPTPTTTPSIPPREVRSVEFAPTPPEAASTLPTVQFSPTRELVLQDTLPLDDREMKTGPVSR